MKKSEEIKEIGARMRNIRTIHGLRQLQAAEKLSVSLSHYSKVEVGLAKASTGFLRRFCSAFGVDEDWLERGIGTPSGHLEVRETASPYTNLLSVKSSIAHNLESEEYKRSIEKIVDAVLDTLRNTDLVNIAESAEKLNLPKERLLRIVMVEKLSEKVQNGCFSSENNNNNLCNHASSCKLDNCGEWQQLNSVMGLLQGHE